LFNIASIRIREFQLKMKTALTASFFEHFKQNLFSYVALWLSLSFFLSGSWFFIDEKSTFEKLIPTFLGSISGFAGGSLVGWVIGGIGVAAFGTAFGISAATMVVIGAVTGATFGGLSGSSYALFKMVSEPEYYNIDYFFLSLLSIITFIYYLIVKYGMVLGYYTFKKMLGLIQRIFDC
jgi:hypothetical protein